MGRRYKGNMDGERYLANTNTKELHDLDKEYIKCKIDQIINSGHDKPFNSMIAAVYEGFKSCKWCIGNVGKMG